MTVKIKKGKRKRKVRKKKVKDKKLNFKDFARSEISELKFGAGGFIVLAFIMNPRGEYTGFDWDMFLIALFFIALFFCASVYYKFRNWIKYLKEEEYDNY